MVKQAAVNSHAAMANIRGRKRAARMQMHFLLRTAPDQVARRAIHFWEVEAFMLAVHHVHSSYFALLYLTRLDLATQVVEFFDVIEHYRNVVFRKTPPAVDAPTLPTYDAATIDSQHPAIYIYKMMVRNYPWKEEEEGAAAGDDSTVGGASAGTPTATTTAATPAKEEPPGPGEEGYTPKTFSTHETRARSLAPLPWLERGRGIWNYLGYATAKGLDDGAMKSLLRAGASPILLRESVFDFTFVANGPEGVGYEATLHWSRYQPKPLTQAMIDAVMARPHKAAVHAQLAAAAPAAAEGEGVAEAPLSCMARNFLSAHAHPAFAVWVLKRLYSFIADNRGGCGAAGAAPRACGACGATPDFILAPPHHPQKEVFCETCFWIGFCGVDDPVHARFACPVTGIDLDATDPAADCAHFFRHQSTLPDAAATDAERAVWDWGNREHARTRKVLSKARFDLQPKPKPKDAPSENKFFDLGPKSQAATNGSKGGAPGAAPGEGKKKQKKKEKKEEEKRAKEAAAAAASGVADATEGDAKGSPAPATAEAAIPDINADRSAAVAAAKDPRRAAKEERKKMMAANKGRMPTRRDADEEKFRKEETGFRALPLLATKRLSPAVEQDNRMSEFATACINGDLLRAKALVEMGVDVDASCNEYLQTPLFLACYSGKSEVVAFLVDDLAADTTLSSNGGISTCEAVAAANGEWGIVDFLKSRRGAAAAASPSTHTALYAAPVARLMHGAPAGERYLDADGECTSQRWMVGNLGEYLRGVDGAPAVHVDANGNGNAPATGKVTSLIDVGQPHAGAGSFTIDEDFPRETLLWLGKVFEKMPLAEVAPKAGTAERRYFCDSEGVVGCMLRDVIMRNLGALADLSEMGAKVAPVGEAVDAEGELEGPVTLRECLVYPHMRFLNYSEVGGKVAPHTDLARTTADGVHRSSHTFILYLSEVSGTTITQPKAPAEGVHPIELPASAVADGGPGGETWLLEDMPNPQNDFNPAPRNRVRPLEGRLLLFPHECPHEGRLVVRPPKVLLRGEVKLIYS